MWRSLAPPAATAATASRRSSTCIGRRSRGRRPTCGRPRRGCGRPLFDAVPHDPRLALVDRFPSPACQFGRARRFRRFRGEAASGEDFVIRQTVYGFGVHVRRCGPGVLGRFVLAPANMWEPAVVLLLAEHTGGLLHGDRNSDAPRIAAEVARQGIQLLAPPRHTSRDLHPSWDLILSSVRSRIDAVFG